MADSLIMDDIEAFLGCPTSSRWLSAALENLETLLVDHAQCEQKAAATAMRLMYRYPSDTELVLRMSRLAREELRHFEQVLALMKARGLSYRKQTAARYASGLRDLVRKNEPGCLVDLLISGAFIEARSCERFAKLAPLLDSELSSFYVGLLASEGRHFRHYIKLARDRAAREQDADDTDQRIRIFRVREAELIDSVDPLFRFHSGVPC
jgi:tRNA-(ms[2]io[6]A)-hydroxylase